MTSIELEKIEWTKSRMIQPSKSSKFKISLLFTNLETSDP